MKKRIIALILCALALAGCFSSCAAQSGDNSGKTTVRAVDLEYAHALELDEAGKWNGALTLYEDLVKQGYHPELKDKIAEYNLRNIREYALHWVINGNGSEYSLLSRVKNLQNVTILNVTEKVEYKYDTWAYSVTVDYEYNSLAYGTRRDTYTSTCSYVAEEDKIDGKIIPVTVPDLNSLKVAPDKWLDQTSGDDYLYKKSLAADYPDNIWNKYD